MNWKKYTEGDLHCFKYVSGEPTGDAPLEAARQRLQTFLQLAAKLLQGLETYCLVRYTPALAAKAFVEPAMQVSWKYSLLANDFTGLGVDRGFEPVADGKGNDPGCLLFRLNDIEQLSEMPEDVFGDFASELSCFGLGAESQNRLQNFMVLEQPALSSLLQPGELFLHLVVGKEQGFYDALLVKAGKEALHRVAQL